MTNTVKQLGGFILKNKRAMRTQLKVKKETEWNAELIKEYILLAEDNTYEAVDAWLNYILPYDRGVKNALELFKRCFMGTYNNIEHAAEDYFFHEYRNMIEPYWVEDCIDYTKLARILVQDEILLPIYYDVLGLSSVFVFSKIDNWEE